MRGRGPSKPVIDGSAPDWARQHAEDVLAYIEMLLARIKTLEADNVTLKERLEAANIP